VLGINAQWSRVREKSFTGAPSASATDQAKAPATVRKWIDDKGRGKRVETNGEGKSTITEFTADQPDPSIGLGDSWRSLFSFDQVTSLPARSPI
jgi:hypothetical protein